MEMSKLILAALRALLLLSAAVVLGTSVDLYQFLPKYQDACNAVYEDKLCDLQGLIPALGYGCFVGALGLLAALAGIVATFIDAIPTIVVLGLEAFSGVVYLSGGLALSIILSKSTFDNASGSRYTEIKADTAFQFIGFIVTMVVVGLGFVWRGRGGRHSAV
ncbi:uncharacterized protein LTR77_001987 [Saxophila tyrrhenica]|uniref:MARVEL domain-containing protein n=1 Tax=Saxophila tyrrhenica TaxID=1690608 RepID=A0AAV9PLT3_9PEZI|nr:hypothetical protein LTR77_001987 [Saxophila tyrrhenica]